MPYVRGVSEQIRRVLGNYDIPSFFKPYNTIRQLLVRPKDPVDKERVVGPVYHIKCDTCGEDYVGETGCSLKTRFDQHRRPSSKSSEVSRHLHSHSPPHSISLADTKVLNVDLRWYERGVKEAIHIKTGRPSLNKDGGRVTLNHIWDNLLRAHINDGQGSPRGGLDISHQACSSGL